MKIIKILPLLFGLILLVNCSNEKGPVPISDMQTYEVIQTQIWDTQCISCHSAGSTFAKQSNLVLTTGESYDQLVGRLPDNEAAREDGLELVGTEGLPSLFKSYLWEKINANDQEHFYSDHPHYGAIMPLGGDFLTNGQLEFIREWIISGAPESGQVADVALLADETRFKEIPFEPLPLPERGFQFHVGPFEVLPNSDRELFTYQSIDSEEDIYIDQVEIVMRPGSHHFIFYTFDDDTPSHFFPNEGDIRDIYDDGGNLNYSNLIALQYHNFIAGTQWPRMNYKYPEGVALRIPAGKGFDMNSHYANRTDEVVTGEVYGNIHTVPQEEVNYVAEILDLNNQDFSLPPNKVTTITKEYTFNERMHIFQLFSHAHEHMTEFNVYKVGGANDGELLYVSFDWEHPPILELDPPIVLNPGEGLRLEATYDNWENRTLSFGLRSSDEMMILFGAYYTD
ncbi:Copper type II ascorbate-dependent monooxygenase, C-terminal domain [Ekhidna lutea]|uniref:Copper type II ascorbate-dependent monooxygenase, C-terminal domain n=1 Tax=Ekhidna lutea TaxID=447679 RepID=A0A239EEA9_EKHLU|nr:hypothetical protein [Ekhidna lutea]SNS42869.1 Copper type II ascorbate-dependent monooxygenase, C-terminal domain [Ekhidna lutea]